MPFAFGHVGDGNIHLAVRAAEGQDEALLLARDAIEQAVHETVRSLGGSISAEHGLGLAKNEIIGDYKDAEEISLMKSLKAVLDPKNILNPGKVLPSDCLRRSL